MHNFSPDCTIGICIVLYSACRVSSYNSWARTLQNEWYIILNRPIYYDSRNYSHRQRPRLTLPSTVWHDTLRCPTNLNGTWRNHHNIVCISIIVITPLCQLGFCKKKRWNSFFTSFLIFCKEKNKESFRVAFLFLVTVISVTILSKYIL